MDYADNYFHSVAKMTRVANEEILKNSWPTFDCNQMRGQLVLDVGCGDGSSTMQVLKPFLGDDVILEASDLSDAMIEYANNKYTNDGVEFFVWNVEDEMLARDMEEKYDHVFSFLCLQFTQDLRKAMKNIYKILKPGGSFFFTMFTRMPYYDAYKKLASYPKWAPYLKEEHFSQYSAPFQNEPDPLGACTDLMVECGFEKIEVKRSSTPLKPESWQQISGMAKFGDRLRDKLPEELRESYMQDFTQELKNDEGFISEKKDEHGQLYLAIHGKNGREDIIAYGVKPAS